MSECPGYILSTAQLQSPVRHIWSAMFCGGLPNARKTWTYWRPKIIKGLEHVSHRKTRRELGLFSPENKNLRRELINVYKYLWKEPDPSKLCPVTG